MKKTYGVSKKTKGAFGYNKHLRKDGKRRANKDTRRAKQDQFFYDYIVNAFKR